MNNNLEEKKNKLLDRYRGLFVQKTGFTGNMLDNYVTNLIIIGEKQYGSNFTEDILKEKRNDSILWLMDEVSKNGGMVTANIIQDKVKDTLQETANAFSAANQQALQTQVSQKEQILELIDKMDEYEFENYLKELSWTSSNYAKYNGIVNYKKSQNPDESEFKISKDVLKSMADDIELVFPQTKKVNSSVSVNDTLNGYVMVENTINNSEELTDNQKQEFRNTLWNDFDNYVEQNPESGKISNQITEPSIVDASEPLIESESVEEVQPAKLETTVIPNTARVGKRKEAPKTLVSKFKEKWKNASFKKKLLIGAVAVGAIIGVGVIAATAISQMIATQSFDANSIMASNNIASGLIDSLDFSSVDTNSTVDWSSIGQGTEVHTTLNDALTDTNTLTSNEWMNVDHMEAVNAAGDVVNLDDMTVDQVNQTLDSGDYGVRGSSNGTYMGWFDEETVKDAINQGKVL